MSTSETNTTLRGIRTKRGRSSREMCCGSPIFTNPCSLSTSQFEGRASRCFLVRACTESRSSKQIMHASHVVLSTSRSCYVMRMVSPEQVMLFLRHCRSELEEFTSHRSFTARQITFPPRPWFGQLNEEAVYHSLG